MESQQFGDNPADHPPAHVAGTAARHQSLPQPGQELPSVPAIRAPDVDWLSEVLGARITDLKARVIGASRGFVSTTWHLQLQGDPPGSVPASLVLKGESNDPEFRELGRQSCCFEREINFYRHLAGRVAGGVPTIHATGSGGAGDSWLLMQDLSHLRAGDQVRGMTQRETRAVVRGIAAVHASTWMDASLQEYAWLPSQAYWFQHPDPALLRPFLHDYGPRLCDDGETLIRAVLEQEEAIQGALRDRPWALVHGDLRADNILFGGEDGDPTATILDWAAVTRGLAAVDLSFLVGGSESPAERAGHLDELLYLWHGELLAHGVRGYGLADARHDLQLATLRCTTAAVKLYRLLNDPEISVRTALFVDQAIQRHCAALLELKAWQALPHPLPDTL